MKSWRLCLLALSTVVAVSAEDGTASSSPPPVTTPPTKLDVAQMSSTSVFLRWEWVEDEAALANVKFNVTATAEGGDAKAMLVEGRLYVVMDALQPGKAYDISVALVKTDGTTLPSDPQRIQLEEKDFLRPSINGNKAGEKKDPISVPYTTTWEYKANPSAGELTGFEVLYCKSSCIMELVNKDDNSFTRPLDYYTNYTVLVVAKTVGAAGEEIKLASPISVFETVPGQPGQVENLNVEQIQDTLDVNITWSPPSQPNGEIKSYNLQIQNGENNIVSESLKVTSYIYSIKTKEQVVEALNITVQAVNNGDDASKNGVVVKKPYKLQKPEPPAELKLKTCDTTSIGIEIVRKIVVPLKFQVIYASNQTLISDTADVLLTGFQTYQRVPVSVAACLPLDGENLLCGAAKNETFWSNVEAPSKVRDLIFVGSESKLTWKEPENRGGPIDGYVVRIADKSKGGDTEAEVAGDVLSYSFATMKNCTRYALYVTAYNKDILSGEKKNGVLSDMVSYTSENCEGGNGLPAWAIVLIVLVVLGAAGGGAFYYMKVYRNS